MLEGKQERGKKRTQKAYSLAFKLQIVEEVEKGGLTYKQAQNKYGIQGSSTVLVWLRKYGRLNWKKRNPMKGKETPQEEIRRLKKELRRVETDKKILQIAIDVAEKELGIEIRKKYLAKLFGIVDNKGKELE
jgi:transposase-like protein